MSLILGTIILLSVAANCIAANEGVVAKVSGTCKMLSDVSLLIPTNGLLRDFRNDAADESFINHLVSDHSCHRCFLVINVDSPSYKGKAIINNSNLLFFLYQTQGIPQAKYESFARNLLVNQSPLKTKVVKLHRWGFRRIIKVPPVDAVAARGKEEFIQYYFGGWQGRVLKAGVGDDEKNAIIDKLFDWQIATMPDDETGLLILTRFDQH